MTTVTLLDGRQVDSASEEWRAECAARHEEAMRVAELRGTGPRRQYLFEVEKSRGQLCADRLRDEVKRIWENR